jgi:type IX secretion system PorP/SprF family membrane protein
MRGENFVYRTASLCIFLVGVMLLQGIAQQRPQFTQFMYNNLVINPAYAGAEEVLSLTLVNRNQWSGVEKAPTTQSFSAHTLLKKKKVGLGLTLISDRIGVHNNTSVLTNYAYHIRVGRQSTLSMGLQVGITNLKSDYASLSGNSNDPNLSNSINETMLGFGTGIYFRSPKVHLGLSAPELVSKSVQLNDTLSVSIRTMNLFGYARYHFTLSKFIAMEPGLMIKYFPDVPISYDVNLNFIYKNVLTTGFSYRSKESVDFILKLQLTSQLQFGYAYDYPVNFAANLSSASHELMLNYQFRNIHKHVTSPR